MRRTNPSSIILLALLCVLTSILLSAGVSAQAEDPEARTSIILADIDSDPIEKIEELQPFVDFLAAGLKEFGIEYGEVRIAPDMETMIDWLAAGEVDIVFDNAYPALVMINEANAVPVLRAWKDGLPVYHSVFFANDDSGLESLEDLQGHIVAFNEELSTTGYMLPKAHLLELGLNPVEKARLTSRVADEQIGYYFSGDDEITIQLVISGRVIAGVIDSGDFDELSETTSERMVVLGETDDIVRSIMIVRADMDPELLEAITDILIVMHEDDEALEILDTIGIDEFELFPEGVETAIDALQDMFDLVQH